VIGGGGGAAHAPQVAQVWMPIFVSGLLFAESHHFDGWQRCGDVVLEADSQTHGLPQPARWSVVARQAEQLFAGTGSTQHATILLPSTQALASGSASVRSSTQPIATARNLILSPRYPPSSRSLARLPGAHQRYTRK
jgi:hypothetical protein